MADKMLRVAGRRGDGLAKPITVTQDGSLRTTMVQPTTYFGNYEFETDDDYKLLGLKQDYATQLTTGRTYGTKSAESETATGYRISVNSANLAFVNANNLLFSVDPTGNIIWKKTALDLHPSHVNVNGVLVDNNSVYTGTSSATRQNGVIVKLDLEGNKIWTAPLPLPNELTNIRSMLERGSKLYIMTRGGNLVIMLKSDGSIVDSLKITGTSVLQYIDAKGNLYVTNISPTNTLVKYNEGLSAVWNYNLSDGFYVSNVVVKDGFVFMHATDIVMRLNSETGALVDSFQSNELWSSFIGFTIQDNIYSIGDNKLTKFNLKKMRIEFTLDISDKKIAAIFEKGNSLFIIGQDGALQRVSTDLHEKALSTLSKEGIIADVISKPMNSGDLEIYETYKGYKVIAMLHENYLVQKDNVYYVLHGGWKAAPLQVSLPAGVLKWANFVEDKYSWWDSRYRLVVNVDNKIFHNYADTQQINPNAWQESTVWGLPNMLHPTDKTTTTYKGRTRYKYHVPSTATDAFQYMGGMQHYRMTTDFEENYLCQDSLWFATYSQSATPAAVFMTKNGKDIYAEYMYGIYPALSRIGKHIDASALSGTLPSDMKIQKITAVIPNASNPEPIDVFSYGLKTNVSGIAYADGKTTVTATGHGLASGDVIRFEASEPENINDWLKPATYASMLNNNISTAWESATKPPLGNGKVYQVIRVSDNSFTLHEAVGNPHNNLHCVHIHSLDVIPNGIIVSTGESGVTSNITFLSLNSEQGTLSYLPANQRRAFAEFAQVHLTANTQQDIKGAVQRPLGFYMEEDYYLFASDEQIYKREVGMGEGRTPFGFRSNGIYKGKLSEINDWSKAKAVLQPQGVAFLFKKIGDLFITCDVTGEAYYSTNKGDDWHKLYLFNSYITKFRGASRDGKEFVIGGYYFINKS